jgi:hypothetical protein
VANALQEQFAEVLLDRIRGDMYPSTTQMDLLEEAAPPRQRAEFAIHLFERIQAEQYPSTSMLARARRLAEAFGG